jgi:uncharacterized Zn finger protein
MTANLPAEVPKKSGRKRGRPPGIKACLALESSHWWTAGFVEYLTKTVSTKQANAAKNYARAGRVLELDVTPGFICAKVQGKRKSPYLVRIKFSLPDGDRLRHIMTALRKKAVYGSMLLSGEIPRELGDIFESAGVSLHPVSSSCLHHMCTCSEPDETCKHVLAVWYAASAAFDRDPFMLLKLKGLEKKTLMEFLCAPVSPLESHPARGPSSGGGKPACRAASGGEREIPGQALDASFYAPPGLTEELSRDAVSSEGSIYPLPISEFPTWRGETSFSDSVAPYYKAVKKFFQGGDRNE